MGPTRMRLWKPVIAAVEGHAVAGGLELALWCDLRVVAEDAMFGVFCRRWGVPLIDGGTVRLPRLIGAGAGAGPHPHRPAGRGDRGARHGAGRPGGAAGRRPARPPRRSPASWPRCRRSACATTGSRCSSRKVSARRTRSGSSSSTACGRSTPARSRVPRGSRQGRAGTGREHPSGGADDDQSSGTLALVDLPAVFERDRLGLAGGVRTMGSAGLLGRRRICGSPGVGRSLSTRAPRSQRRQARGVRRKSAAKMTA